MRIFIPHVFCAFLLASLNVGCFSFELYDGTHYAGKPDLQAYGIKPANLIIGRFLWPDKKLTSDVPGRESMVAAMKAYAIKGSGDIICLDIEHWEMNGKKETREQSINNYLQVLNYAKEAYPGKKIGFYGVPPVRNYWAPIRDHAHPRYKAWDDLNNELARFGAAVDVIFPSLYTFEPSPQNWLKYAEAQVSQARKYNKPVIVFIWPQIHESNKLYGLDNLDPAFWRRQLEFAAEHADGAVIWGGWDFEKWKKAKWDENAAWWKETKDFISNRREDLSSD